jgi:hypothetical protein
VARLEKLPDAAELAPLNLREQRAIAERFFSENPRGAQAMQQRLRESYVLRHACRTPLLLTFACLLHSENLLRSEFTYAQLYAHILRRLIRGTWRNAAEPLASSEVGEERVLCQLETLVWNLFLQSPERNLFTLDAWVSAGSNAPSAPLDPAELLETLERLGVVVAAGYDWRGYPQWSFAHRSILEFLAARHLSRQENWREEISQHFRFQPEWWEVLTFLVGLVENADPLVERLEGSRTTSSARCCCCRRGWWASGASQTPSPSAWQNAQSDTSAERYQRNSPSPPYRLLDAMWFHSSHKPCRMRIGGFPRRRVGRWVRSATRKPSRPFSKPCRMRLGGFARRRVRRWVRSATRKPSRPFSKPCRMRIGGFARRRVRRWGDRRPASHPAPSPSPAG